MFTIEAEAHFDSAHFLKGYQGPCANLHGHRWRIVAQIGAQALRDDGQERAMVADFSALKRPLKAIADALDHSLLFEEGTLKSTTLNALSEEGFKLVALPFRPTAEALSQYIYHQLKAQLSADLSTHGTCDTHGTYGIPSPELMWVKVYETPQAVATYYGCNVNSGGPQ